MAANIITESEYDTPAKPLLNAQLNQKSIRELIRYEVAVMVLKCLNNLAPDYLSILEWLEDLHPVWNFETQRLIFGLQSWIQHNRTKTFSYHEVKVWNSFDENKKEHPQYSLLNPCFRIKYGLWRALLSLHDCSLI